jgi:geranylgeranyl diphosphate synthase type II
MNATQFDIEARIKDFCSLFEGFLDQHLSGSEAVPDALRQSMAYSMRARGKRLRPFLVMTAARVCGDETSSAAPLAVAVECLHVFTLIHDDLPCMDDAALRRGIPVNHRVHGEATAVLAGDALMARAFELAARTKAVMQESLAIVAELASAIGGSGVIGGQVEDLAGESLEPTLPRVQHIHRLKTARLFEACCRVGALAGRGTADQVDCLAQYGVHLGLAFQIADDLLDVESSTGSLGKDAGHDADRNKLTYPAAVGVDESRKAARQASRLACEALREFDGRADELRALADYVVRRTF